ncbi:hypothetical protein BC829DRAFT_288646 [Chytridium lagenaria]|nr:hypothetical protein BC829DRAFT_288646 [Chytridium lagenaria]
MARTCWSWSLVMFLPIQAMMIRRLMQLRKKTAVVADSRMKLTSGNSPRHPYHQIPLPGNPRSFPHRLLPYHRAAFVRDAAYIRSVIHRSASPSPPSRCCTFLVYALPPAPPLTQPLFSLPSRSLTNSVNPSLDAGDGCDVGDAVVALGGCRRC